MSLILVGVPLGNAAGASTRVREVLSTADIVAAEDTRRLARLARDLGITLSGRVVSYFDGNEEFHGNEECRTPELAAALAEGATVAVVTDGGMPSVSDPGYRLVRAAIEAGVTVSTVPGPSAVTTALALSGLPCDRFCFEGFPPRQPAERRVALAALASEPRTLVFFEALHRVAGTLADLAAAFGAERPAALCRELAKTYERELAKTYERELAKTYERELAKTYEEVRRGPLGELAAGAGRSVSGGRAGQLGIAGAAAGVRGEVTLVVAGAPPVAAVRPPDAELAAAVRDLEAGGTPRKAAIATVAVQHALPKRDVYAAVVNSK